MRGTHPHLTKCGSVSVAPIPDSINSHCAGRHPGGVLIGQAQDLGEDECFPPVVVQNVEEFFDVLQDLRAGEEGS